MQAPSRAYVAGATFQEERSTQLSMLALFQVSLSLSLSTSLLNCPIYIFLQIPFKKLFLADHWLCLGPSHSGGPHPSRLQSGILRGSSEVEQSQMLTSLYFCSIKPGHVHPYWLDQRCCWFPKSSPFPARSLSGFYLILGWKNLKGLF